MLPLTTLLGFCLAVIPITVTPGASFSLVSARGLAGDHRGAWATILGTGLGVFTHGLLAGLGLAVVVMQSAQLYGTIRLVGACYLIGLGLVFLWNARRRGDADAAAEPAPPAPPAPPARFGRSVRQAYVANVLNVKAATVYLSLGPEFVAADAVGVASLMQLAAVHVMVMVLWLGFWALGLKQLATRFDARAWRRRIEALGGIVLVGLGIRAAAQPG